MAKNWANGVPDEGRSPESGHRMAAEGIQFPWRGNGSTISTDLDVIWGMSDKVGYGKRTVLCLRCHQAVPFEAAIGRRGESGSPKNASRQI